MTVDGKIQMDIKTRIVSDAFSPKKVSGVFLVIFDNSLFSWFEFILIHPVYTEI